MKRTNSDKDHVIDAIATYICVQAGRKDQFTREVDTAPIAEMLGATYTEQESAHLRAREILCKFLKKRR